MLREELEENYMPFQCMIISSVNKFNLEGFQLLNTIY